MHKLVAGDGYTYLTRHVAAGDAGLEPGQSLTGYYEQTATRPGDGSARDRPAWVTARSPA